MPSRNRKITTMEMAYQDILSLVVFQVHQFNIFFLILVLKFVLDFWLNPRSVKL